MGCGNAHTTSGWYVQQLVFMVLTFTAFVIYGAFASALRNHVLSQPPRMAWLRRSFAVSFAVLGLRLALVER